MDQLTFGPVFLVACEWLVFMVWFCQVDLVEISHAVCCRRPAWVVSVIFFLLHGFASYFSGPPSERG